MQFRFHSPAHLPRTFPAFFYIILALATNTRGEPYTCNFPVNSICEQSGGTNDQVDFTQHLSVSDADPVRGFVRVAALSGDYTVEIGEFKLSEKKYSVCCSQLTRAGRMVKRVLLNTRVCVGETRDKYATCCSDANWGTSEQQMAAYDQNDNVVCCPINQIENSNGVVWPPRCCLSYKKILVKTVADTFMCASECNGKTMPNGDCCASGQEVAKSGSAYTCCPVGQVAKDDGTCGPSCLGTPMPDKSCCNTPADTLYNKGTQCCKSPKVKTTDDQCCDQALATKDNTICCPSGTKPAGNVCCDASTGKDKDGKFNKACCATNDWKVISAKNEVCCNSANNGRDLSGALNAACCPVGQDLKDGTCCPTGKYASTDKICCTSGVLYNDGANCCPTDKYATLDKVCCDKPGDTLFNRNSNCCRGPNVLTLDGKCCDKALSTTEKETCCPTGATPTGNVCCIVDKGQGLDGQCSQACCTKGSWKLDSGDKGVCCNSANNGQDLTGTMNAACCPVGQDLKDGTCCPTGKYASTDKICCTSGVLYNDGANCCPTDKYATLDKVCCDKPGDTLFNRNSNCCRGPNVLTLDGKCCDKALSTTEKETCCPTGATPTGNVCCIVDKGQGLDGQCSQACCTKGSWKLDSGDKGVCCNSANNGQDLTGTMNAACCPVGQDLKDGTCCPTGKYASTDKICCTSGVLYNDGANCCPTDKYATLDKVCCDKPGDTLFNRNSNCCRGPNVLTLDGKCCDKALSTTEKETCCPTGATPTGNVCCIVDKGQGLDGQCSQACCTKGSWKLDSGDKGVCCNSANNGQDLTGTMNAACCPVGQDLKDGTCCPTGKYASTDKICCTSGVLYNDGANCCPTDKYATLDKVCCDKPGDTLFNRNSNCCRGPNVLTLDGKCCDKALATTGKETCCPTGATPTGDVCCIVDKGQGLDGQCSQACCTKGSWKLDSGGKGVCCNSANNGRDLSGALNAACCPVGKVLEGDSCVISCTGAPMSNGTCCKGQVFMNGTIQSCCSSDKALVASPSTKLQQCCNSTDFVNVRGFCCPKSLYMAASDTCCGCNDEMCTSRFSLAYLDSVGNCCPEVFKDVSGLCCMYPEELDSQRKCCKANLIQGICCPNPTDVIDDMRRCCAGKLDSKGLCCTASLVGGSTCCPSATNAIDKAGKCCAGSIDAAGDCCLNALDASKTCCGATSIDAQNKCCLAPNILDAQKKCCPESSQVNKVCCAQSVRTTNGKSACCPEASNNVDKNSQCCIGAIDQNGDCCASPGVLDKNLVCCASCSLGPDGVCADSSTTVSTSSSSVCSTATSTTLIHCKEGRVWINGVCVCPTGTYANEDSCSPCRGNQIMVNGQCKCPKEHYMDGQWCRKCKIEGCRCSRFKRDLAGRKMCRYRELKHY